MGSFTSKATRLPPARTLRKYPQQPPPPPAHSARAPPPPPSNTTTGPPAASTSPDPVKARASKNEEAIKNSSTSDVSDPTYAQSLRAIGPVTPSSTFSHSSTFASSSPFQPPASTSTSTPSPTYDRHNQKSQPPTFLNPALQILSARSRLAAAAEREFARARTGGQGEGEGKGGERGRRFLDVVMVRQVLMLRDDKGVGEGEIEARLGLRRGVVAGLGERGVVGNVGGS